MDDEQIRQNQELADKLLADRIMQGMRYMMGNRSGRALMWYLLEQFGIFQDGFSSDPLVLARSSGRRSSGLQLLQLIDAYSPEKYAKMTEEAREDALTTNPMGDE